MNNKIRTGKRSNRGQLGPLFIVLTVLAGLIFGALALEFSHMSTVRSALHAATDAAALSGAQDLWFDADNCSADAIAVAGMNTADGRAVVDNPPGVTVNVTVTRPQGNNPGQVQVDASMQVTHMFAPFFEHWTDTVSVSSVAGTRGKLWRLAAGQSFPIGISIDQTPTDNKGNILGMPLNQLKPGDSITLYIGSQNFKNAAFTTLTSKPASASQINSMIDEALGLTPKKDVDIPSVAIGDTINLNNGINGQKDLGKEPYLSALKAEPFLIMPIFAGSPPYNQGATVVGFTALKVTDVSNDSSKGMTLSITGTLTNLPQVIGESGPIPTTGDPADDAAITRLELGPIQLIR